MNHLIAIQLEDGSLSDVMADTYGQWAVHVNTDGPGYRISHVPTDSCDRS